MKVFAPFAPFISDKVYRVMTEGLDEAPESVHLCDIPEYREDLVDLALERKMELVRNVAELGRSLRAKHQIKTRQVLPEMLIITRSPEDSAKIEEASKLIKGELNLKSLAFACDEAKYVKLSLKPNLRTLGKKLGKKLRDVKQELESLSADTDTVAKLLQEVEGNGQVQVLGETLMLEDFLIDRGPKDDRLIATNSGVTVLLDTNLTDELIREGLAREVVNRIQNLRKDSGLNVTDKIQVKFHGSSKIELAVQENKAYISSEIQANEWEMVSDTAVDSKFVADFDIGEESCKIGIQVTM